MEINSLVQILETPIKITESSSDGSLWRWGHFAHGITFLVVSMLTWVGINSSMNLHLKKYFDDRDREYNWPLHIILDDGWPTKKNRY